jgi:hypothetical protein
VFAHLHARRPPGSSPARALEGGSTRR